MTSARELFNSPVSYTFDDLILQPGFIDFTVNDVSLETRLTRKINLNVPLISSPMDTVTESEMATALSHLGGIGIIHANCSADKQIEEIKNVKNNSGVTGAAVTTHNSDRKRINNLIDIDTDVLVIDSSQGCSKYQIDTIRYIKEASSSVQVVSGNIVNAKQLEKLLDETDNCIDAFRLNQGVGSICTTQKVTGIGRGQAKTIYAIASALKEMHKDIPIIADGGIRGSGDIVKALALGASTVMIGNLFAGTDEAPGEYFHKGGVRLKVYRGMGSIDAMNSNVNSNVRYNSENSRIKVPQGVTGTVISKGSVKKQVPFILQGVKHGMQNIGAQSIPKLHDNLHSDLTNLEVRTLASQMEGNVHDLYSYEKD